MFVLNPARRHTSLVSAYYRHVKAGLVLSSSMQMESSVSSDHCGVTVMQVVVQSLLLEDALNKGFDLASKEEGQGEVTRDFKALFQQTRSGL